MANADALRPLVELTWQYGPFAFAVVFIYSVSRWSYNKYREAVEKELPPVDVKTHRTVFVGACLSAVALVVVSIGYWLVSQPRTYLFRGEIVNLKDYEHITSSELYRLELRHGRPDDRAPEQRNENFVVIRTRPFKSSDAFAVDFSKGDGKVDELLVPYTADENPRFVIQFDETAKANVLRPARQTPAPRTAEWLGLGTRLYASTLDDQASRPPRAPESVQHMATPTLSPSIESLQAPRSSVGAKINAIGALMKGGITEPLLLSQGAGEPLAITLIDLARHTDRELAYMARAAADVGRLDDVVRRLLLSASGTERTLGESILFRMDTAESRRIVQSLGGAAAAGQLADALASGKRVKNLRPTGSSNGDRYYVQANWSPQDARVTSCLSKLFNDELLTDRTLQQENVLMAGRGQRIVYWYDKGWAIDIAERATACGATAQFVTPHLAS